MTWLSADAWLDACGSWGDRLRGAYAPRGGEDELIAALRGDPRRVFAVVGRPGAGTSRLAFEVARRLGGRYRDPAPAPAPRAEAEAASHLVVLDGPDPFEARALLPALASRRLRPELRVIVPCDPDAAPDLPDLTGLPRGSIAVVAIEGDPVEPPHASVPAAWLPIALAGRGPWPEAAANFVRDPDTSDVVCLLDHRARAALARVADLASILDAHPALRPAITAALLRWTRGALPDAVVPHLDPDLDVLAAIRLGIAPTPALIAHLEASASEIRPDPRGADPRGAFDRASQLPPRGAFDRASENRPRDPAEKRAALARVRRDQGGAAAALQEVAAAADPEARVRAVIALAAMSRERGEAEAAVEQARAAGVQVADALAVLADVRLAAQDPAGARAAYDEAAAIHDADGAVAQAAVVRSWSATIAGDNGALDAAVATIERVIADRRAIGDAQGAALALGRLARWEVERDRPDAARRAAEEAGALAEAIGDPRGEGYAAWFLGALAERGGDGRAAIAHYQRSLTAYAELGDVPERVIDSLATLRRAYDGSPPPDPAPEPPLPPPEPLVTLRRRP